MPKAWVAKNDAIKNIVINIIYKEIKENYSKNDKIDKITEEIMQLKYLLNNVYEQNKKIINCLSENKMYL